jgi:hypothetical protein
MIYKNAEIFPILWLKVGKREYFFATGTVCRNWIFTYIDRFWRQLVHIDLNCRIWDLLTYIFWFNSLISWPKLKNKSVIVIFDKIKLGHRKCKNPSIHIHSYGLWRQNLSIDVKQTYFNSYSAVEIHFFDINLHHNTLNDEILRQCIHQMISIDRFFWRKWI